MKGQTVYVPAYSHIYHGDREQPFFTTKEPGKGTGLGLSISYTIIEKLGGRIIVASEVGKETAFTVYMPVTQEA